MTDISSYSEQEIVPLLRQRDEQSFAYLYDNYSGALFGAILQIVPHRESACDLLQDVFVKIWQKMDSYDPSKGRLFTWMLNIARNQSIDMLRSKSYRNGRKTDPVAYEKNCDGDERAIYLDVDKIGLRKLVGKLPPQYRKLIFLAYFSGYTYSQIAELENMPLGTVKTGIRNSLIKLKAYLTQTEQTIGCPDLEWSVLQAYHRGKDAG